MRRLTGRGRVEEQTADAAKTVDEMLGLVRRGRMGEAIGLLHAAVVRESSPEAVRTLAEAYALRGNWDKALEYARRWVSLEPGSDAGRLFLVIVLNVSGRRHNARQEAERS